MKKTFLILSLLVTGCSGTRYLGQVGDTKFYSVSSSKADGPNFNALVSEKNHVAKIETTFSGPGLMPSVAPPLIQAGQSLGGDVISKGIILKAN